MCIEIVEKNVSSNLIQRNAEAFEELLHKRYEFIVRLDGYEETDFIITVAFFEQNFADISGISKLTDLEWLPDDKSELFDMALSGEITEEMLSESKYYDEYHIKDRTVYLSELEYFMDTYNSVYHCTEYQTEDGPKRFGDAKMFICDNEDEDTFFILFREKNRYSTKYVPIDFMSSAWFDKQDPRDSDENEETDLMRKSRWQ